MTNKPCDCTRRSALRSLVGGSLLLPGVISNLLAADATPSNDSDPLAPRVPHFPAKAKRVIFLCMSGGVSHVDSFDYKPKLFADAGKAMPGNPHQNNRFLTRPLWDFKPRGKCGTQVSELFPHIAECVDDICVINSLKSDHGNHYEATLEIHTGSFTFTRPSIGSWVSYGLGLKTPISRRSSRFARRWHTAASITGARRSCPLCTRERRWAMPVFRPTRPA